MVFMLDGGPRDGQLVDDLPVGYERASQGRRSQVEIVEGLVAERAGWIPRDMRAVFGPDLYALRDRTYPFLKGSGASDIR